MITSSERRKRAYKIKEDSKMGDTTLGKPRARRAYWERFKRAFEREMGSEECRFCGCHVNKHIGKSSVPRILIPSGDKWMEKRAGNTTMVERLFCGECAKALNTRQVCCYKRDWGIGEFVGVKAQSK